MYEVSILIGLWIVTNVVQIWIGIHCFTNLFFSLQFIFLYFSLLNFNWFKSSHINHFSHHPYGWSQLSLWNRSIFVSLLDRLLILIMMMILRMNSSSVVYLGSINAYIVYCTWRDWKIVCSLPSIELILWISSWTNT